MHALSSTRAPPPGRVIARSPGVGTRPPQVAGSSHRSSPACKKGHLLRCWSCGVCVCACVHACMWVQHEEDVRGGVTWVQHGTRARSLPLAPARSPRRPQTVPPAAGSLLHPVLHPLPRRCLPCWWRARAAGRRWEGRRARGRPMGPAQSPRPRRRPPGTLTERRRCRSLRLGRGGAGLEARAAFARARGAPPAPPARPSRPPGTHHAGR